MANANATAVVEQVLKMQKEGKSDAEIIAGLTAQGLKSSQISEALNQAKIKEAVTAEAKAKPPSQSIAQAEGLAPSILTRE